MKTAEIRNLTQEELRQKLYTLKEELFKLNIQRKMSRVEKPHSIRELRKEIARINTIINESKRK